MMVNQWRVLISRAREMGRRKDRKPREARAALRHYVEENGSEEAEQSSETLQAMSSLIVRENYGHSSLHMERHSMPRTLASPIGPIDWNEALDIIVYGSPEQSVEGMKVICYELAQTTSDSEGSAMDDVLKDADRLVLFLAKVPKTFDFSKTGASSSLCKFVLNTLMQTFQNKRLAHAVKESTLDSLIIELLLWLLYERVPMMHYSSRLLKVLKDNAEQISSLGALINLLRFPDPTSRPSLPLNESFAMTNQKFSDMVVKCLIKLTKVLQNPIYEVILVHSIHVYLQKLGMKVIRKREDYGHSSLHIEKHSMPRTPASPIGPVDWNEALDIIFYGSPEQSVEGMKVICHELAKL